MEDGGEGGGGWEGEYRDGEVVNVQSEVGFIVSLFLLFRGVCGGGILDVEIHKGMHWSLGFGVVAVVDFVVEEEDEGGVGVGEAVEVVNSGESLRAGCVCWREEQEVGGLVDVSAVRLWCAQGEVMSAQVCLWIGSVWRLKGSTLWLRIPVHRPLDCRRLVAVTAHVGCCRRLVQTRFDGVESSREQSIWDQISTKCSRFERCS